MNVILHVVLEHDGIETRRRDGALVPVLALAPYLTEPLTFDPAAADWSRFGGEACAPDLTRREPKALRAILGAWVMTASPRRPPAWRRG